MPGRVEAHPYVRLGLVGRHAGAALQRVAQPGLQIVHLNLEMKLHLLVAGPAGHTGCTWLGSS